MALVVKDRVKVRSSTTGTGTLTLGTAFAGFQTFNNALGNGDTTYYGIFESSTGKFEVGLGTFTSSGNTLSRDTILESSNAGAAINLTADTEVFITYPAEKSVYFDASGDLTLNQDPTSALQAATKQYVDTIAAAGIHYHTPVRVESPSNLTATYDNGTAGVGATLTNSGTQAALVIDGITLSTSDRVLVYNQTNAAHNGIYTVTNTGSASTNWVLTRATDADSYGPSDPDALGEGDAFFVSEGNTGAGELYVMNTSGTITFGTTNITFAIIAETAVYSAGDGLTLTGTTFAVGAGTGVTVNANDVAIGQPVGTGDTVTFATVNANLTGNVTGNVSGSSGSTTGNAATATALQTGRTISLTGDVTGTSGTFDGTGNVSIAATIAANAVALGTDTTGNYVATGAVSGNGLSGSASAEGATFTVTSNATNANTPSTIVFRDGSGNFSAGTITANLSGNATTATTATTANGVAANSVALGTDTTGNYVATIATNAGLDGSGSSEGAAVTLSLNLSELTTSTSDADGDFFVVVDSANAQKKLTKANINISGFNNDAGYTTNVGDITGVTAGSFITGGGTSGTVTINVDATSANTASKVVARDGSGNFSAGTITAALTGNASTASALQTARNIALTGAVTGNANFDGSGNISISTTATSDPTLTLNGDATGSATFTNLGNATLTVTVVDDSHNHIISNVDGLQTALDGKYSTSGGTISGNVTVDNGTSTVINVVSDDTGTSGIRLYGAAQGTGYVEVGQSTTYGGGMSYNGDGSPPFVSGETADNITFYALNAGVRTEVFHYSYLGGAVNFNSTPTVGGSNVVWNAGNDGSGSGLDADLLDGNHASAFQTASTALGYVDVATGNYGTIKVDDDRGVTWAGYAIRDDWVFMANGASEAGIYNDTDNEWGIKFFQNGQTSLYYDGSGKLSTTSGGVAVTGALTATGDITAYFSDERLKDFDGKIEGALDKVSQLNGYYYHENDKAKELGFNNDARQVGVSAQEVEAVLPEVIKPAPVDPEYKTVQYEKLVPLLIEAIKELKEEVRQLKEDKA